MNTLLFLITICAAGPIRHFQKPIQLYAKTGRFMTVQNTGSVTPEKLRNTNSIIDIIPVSGQRNQFILKNIRDQGCFQSNDV